MANRSQFGGIEFNRENWVLSGNFRFLFCLVCDALIEIVKIIGQQRSITEIIEMTGTALLLSLFI